MNVGISAGCFPSGATLSIFVSATKECRTFSGATKGLGRLDRASVPVSSAVLRRVRTSDPVLKQQLPARLPDAQ